MRLTIHPSAHPQIYLAGGDIFSKDSYARFDGIIIYYSRGFNGLSATTEDAVRHGSIPVPHRVHNVRRSGSTPRYVSYSVKHDLSVLADQGCQRIAMHAPNDMIQAKAAIRSAVHWLDSHPGAVESVTFVDLADDYYHCFGLDAFEQGPEKMKNPEPTGFETYFEQEFPHELARQFGIIRDKDFFPGCIVTEKPVSVDLFTARQFSVALFYTVLVPQAIAKVTGDIQDMYAFSRCADWPLMDRYSGGWMAPHVYLEDTGLASQGKQIPEWIACAEAELPYFCRLATHHILSGIRSPRKNDEIRLSHIGQKAIKAIHRELRAQLDAYTGYLHGAKEPNPYYLPDKILKG